MRSQLIELDTCYADLFVQFNVNETIGARNSFRANLS